MGKKIRKGTRGTAAQYLTRGASLKKLQVSLADFRRLCILKDVYPRDPKKKLKGKDKTYYHAKDIIYLYHEPILQKFRDLRVFMRKYRRAIGRRETSIARSLEARRPVYGLFHLVKERYPTLLDAVKDLDDSLSTIALFASLPVNDEKAITADTVAESSRLLDEMLLYISEKKRLRKVFCSIKGYYFQFKLLGELVTFLLPHQFPQDLPAEVDFKVMLTFLEFYSYVLKTVSFKLYQISNMRYPPSANISMIKAGCRFLALSTENTAEPVQAAKVAEDQEQRSEISTTTLESLKQKLSQRNVVDGDDDDDDRSDCGPVGDEDDAVEKFDGNEEVNEADDLLTKIEKASEEEFRLLSLFSNCIFFISREVPLVPVALCLRSCGATMIGWQGEGSPLEEDDPKITHHIVDRPLTDNLKAYCNERELLQPQWVFDSLNNGILLPVAPYGVGQLPPPHLSPFVDDVRLGYVPEQRVVLQTLTREAKERETANLCREEDDDDNDVEDVAIEEAGFQKDLSAEKRKEESTPAAVTEKDAELRKTRKQQQKNAEDVERRKALLSKKHKRLLERIEYGHEKKQEKIASLKKRKAAAAVKSN